MHERLRTHLGDWTSARLVEAGLCAAADEQWRIAVRCYRAALEIDLLDRRVLARLLGLGARAGEEWSDYARQVDRVDWPHFGCRGTSIVTGDGRAVVRCPEVGVVLTLAMPERDVFSVRASSAFAGMPLAMALVILRCALWPDARALWLEQRHRPAMQVGVRFEDKMSVWLDELGDWRPR